jgi:hypothetical protein
VVATALADTVALPFAPEDVALTHGGFGAIALMLKLFANPGEEIIHPRPAWFCCEGLGSINVERRFPLCHLRRSAIRGVPGPVRLSLTASNACRGGDVHGPACGAGPRTTA